MTIGFSFTEDQELFRRTVRNFAMKELLPNSAKWDKEHRVPWEVGKQMAELGLTGLRIPAEYGGTPADFVTCGIALEEVARGDFSMINFVALCAVLGDVISRHVTNEDVKQEWLPKIARGEVIPALALTEPQCGSDAGAIRTTAVRDGDHYVLNGEKASITLHESELCVLFAKTDLSAGPRGISAFLVPLDTPGIGHSTFNDLGSHAIRRGALHLDNVRVPAKNLVGREGQGFYIVMNEFDFTRAFIALGAIGTAQQCVDETCDYVKTRTAFGQPIARFEGVSFPLAEAATHLEGVRLLSYKVLYLRDQSMPHVKEAAMVKWWAPRLAVEVIHQCLLLHGHAGYSDDYPMGQRLRDVIGLEIGDGTAEIMKLVISREMMGREFRPY